MKARTLLVGVAAAVLAFLVLLVREVTQVPRSTRLEPNKASVHPLTDVSGRGAWPTIGTTEPTPPPHQINTDGQKIVAPAPYILPKDLRDPTHPPQWTKPLVVPENPTPPDPFVPPEVAQDPNRGGRVE